MGHNPTFHMIEEDFNRKFGSLEDRPSILAKFNRRATGQINDMNRRVILQVFKGNPYILTAYMITYFEILYALSVFCPADQNIHRHPHTQEGRSA